MVSKYKSTCKSCNASFIVDYGRSSPTVVYDVYSCPNCKNLFSKSNIDELSCPNCNNKDLIHYNVHKIENIRYYKKMFANGLISQEKYEFLLEYWNKIQNEKCPICGKDALDWEIIEKDKKK